VTDALLVRAPVGVVYRALSDLDGWPRWLHGCRSVRLPGQPDEVCGDRHVLTLPDGRRAWRLAVTAHSWRHDAGLRWDVRGDVVLDAEWWLEGRAEGTVVHHVVHGSPEGRRAARRVLRHRRVIILALQELKDHLELAVAVAAGRVP
jgi:uncharacterized protein YndB with AHSA1/START domain